MAGQGLRGLAVFCGERLAVEGSNRTFAFRASGGRGDRRVVLAGREGEKKNTDKSDGADHDRAVEDFCGGISFFLKQASWSRSFLRTQCPFGSHRNTFGEADPLFKDNLRGSGLNSVNPTPMNIQLAAKAQSQRPQKADGFKFLPPRDDAV